MRRLMPKRIAFLLLFTLYFLPACNAPETEIQNSRVPAKQPKKNIQLFKNLSASETGLDFNNIFIEDSQNNYLKWDYLYNGGGVAIGDINNDGLPDVYLTGTVAPDKLFLNKGSMKFQDITDKSGISDRKGLKTGVSMVDINADGWLDIYVCRSGFPKDPSLWKNLLFINQQDGTFKEEARNFGLDDPGNSVMAGFADFDKDGDLDMYLTQHPGFKMTYNKVFEGIANPEPKVSDKLYRNDGNNHFTDISKAAGVTNWGHGLGLGISDVNQDGWPDVYVANDFQVPDFYYENNKNGTFSQKFQNYFPHSSYFSMGCDIADIDNDEDLDVFVVEMLAEDNQRQKTNMASMNPEKFWYHVQKGLYFQYMHNALHLNNGNGSFSDIAYFAGISKTDWSWATFFADLDNDGFKDLVVSNGYLKDTQDKDYEKKAEEIAMKNGGIAPFGDLMQHIPSTPIPNKVFRNQGDRTFSDMSHQWGLDFSGFSNGLAYGDLDGDGDLDLIVNNFNHEAGVYENRAADEKLNASIRIKLEGTDQNKFGIGTKITLKTTSGIQFVEMQPVRGFQSTVENIVHFGLETGTDVISCKVVWPDGKEEVLKNLTLNQLNKVAYKNAVSGSQPVIPHPDPDFIPVLAGDQPSFFTHKENNYDDFLKEILLPHKNSQHGPKIITGDINGDGINEFYVGGAAGSPGSLFFVRSGMKIGSLMGELAMQDKAHEDLGGCFFDADGDGDQDLYVVSGGNEFPAESPLYQDRLYINVGEGNFKKAAAGTLPVMLTSGGCAIPGDFDGDGDLDLFVGGRILPAMYPHAPRSYLLRNDKGKFTDITGEVSPDLLTPGLVTSALWTDFNRDGKTDLIIAGEWMPIMVFENIGGKLINKTKELALENSAGWWYSLAEADLDGDGDMDYIAGNLGLNYKYQASEKEPFQVYSGDFDENGKNDIVLSYYNKGTYFPVRGRQCSSQQIPEIAEKFKTYAEFGKASVEQVYGEKIKTALNLKAYTFASMVLLNQGGEGFVQISLPGEAQYSPINGIIARDINQDQMVDLIVAGNLWAAEVETPRADAGIGLVLYGKGNGFFSPRNTSESGFFAPLDVKSLAFIQTQPGEPDLLLVGNNNGPLQIFRTARVKSSSKGSKTASVN